ncbi:MAG TPA: ABC transporter permease [Thermoflexia bacterium]|nr:ABC transporter permease [Thermoflexia bacterium]
MWQRIWAVIQKEFIQTFRDKGTVIMLIAIPMLQLFLFGYAVDINVKHIPLVVADQSMDAASRAYVNAMVNSAYFDVVEYVAGEDAVIEAIDAGQASAGIVIPSHFAARVERGNAQVLFLIDGSDLFTVQSGYNAATAIAQNHSAEVLLQKITQSGWPISSTSPLEARLRILYNPDMKQIWFVVPNIAAMVIQTQSIVMTAAAVVREREAGTMEQLLVTPIRPHELLLGKIVPNIVIAGVNVLTVIALGTFLFGVPFQGSFWLFFGLALIYVFSGLGLGLLISTIATDLKQTQEIVMMMMLLGVVLGGFMFPRSSMPPFLYALGYLFPLSYFIPISRGIISKGVGIGSLWEPVGGLVIYSILIMLIATRLFRRGLE